MHKTYLPLPLSRLFLLHIYLFSISTGMAALLPKYSKQESSTILDVFIESFYYISEYSWLLPPEFRPSSGLTSAHDTWVDYYWSQLLLYENLPAWDVKQANHFLKQTSTDYLPESLLVWCKPSQDQNLIFYLEPKDSPVTEMWGL